MTAHNTSALPVTARYFSVNTRFSSSFFLVLLTKTLLSSVKKTNLNKTAHTECRANC